MIDAARSLDAAELPADDGHGGAVTLMQRLGSPPTSTYTCIAFGPRAGQKMLTLHGRDAA
jgi:hypothetical protein